MIRERGSDRIDLPDSAGHSDPEDNTGPYLVTAAGVRNSGLRAEILGTNDQVTFGNHSWYFIFSIVLAWQHTIYQGKITQKEMLDLIPKTPNEAFVSWFLQVLEIKQLTHT